MTAIYLLACYGVTFLLVDASILETPRRWLLNRVPGMQSLFTCYFCTGFWVSLALRYARWGLDALLYWAFAGAAVTYLLDVTSRTVERMELP